MKILALAEANATPVERLRDDERAGPLDAESGAHARGAPHVRGSHRTARQP